MAIYSLDQNLTKKTENICLENLNEKHTTKKY